MSTSSATIVCSLSWRLKLHCIDWATQYVKSAERHLSVSFSTSTHSYMWVLLSHFQWKHYPHFQWKNCPSAIIEFSINMLILLESGMLKQEDDHRHPCTVSIQVGVRQKTYNIWRRNFQFQICGRHPHIDVWQCAVKALEPLPLLLHRSAVQDQFLATRNDGECCRWRITINDYACIGPKIQCSQ